MTTGKAAPKREMTPEQQFLADAALTTFRLNGQFLALAETLARPAGLTARRWQVLGAVLREPLPVSGIARAMGLSRQAVQRMADALVADGMVSYQDNPAHRRAKLLQPTELGREAVRRIYPDHRMAAATLASLLGEGRAHEMLTALRDLSAALDQVRRS